MSQFGNNWGSYGGGQPGQGQGYGPAPQPQQQQQQPAQGYGPPPPAQGYGAPPGPQPMGYAPHVHGVAPYGPSALGAWMCRWCGYQGFPLQTRKMSQTGIIVMVVLILFFLPLFWIGFLIKETVTSCPVCRRQ